MLLVTMMIETGETKANLDEKECPALQKFQTASEKSTLDTAVILIEILFPCDIITNRIDS